MLLRVLGLTIAGSLAVAEAQEVGSRICAGCHASIARTYAQSPMSRSSGRVADLPAVLPESSFVDPSTGSAYAIQRGAGSLRLQATRESTGLNATRDLNWFVGSGRVGRSFLFQIDEGWLYQSPVSWYTSASAWKASPGFAKRTVVDFTRPVESSCLLCHASRLQPAAGTQNQYAAQAPFLENGIGCERCHGAGARHVALMQARTQASKDYGIVNPAKLGAVERDSVCAQCHLTGAARVSRVTTKGRASWRPGEDLARSVAVFVWAGARDSDLTVTSHFEKLAWSRCKEESGDKLWCGTCHDPHGGKVDVRARCTGCHSAPAAKQCSLPAAERTAQRDQCQTCHMPQGEVTDAEHAVYTDHSIPRRPRPLANSAAVKGELLPFFRRTPVDPRDLALAYAVTALTEPSVRRTAFELLRAAAGKDPADLAIAGQLGQFLDRMGRGAEAISLLERVVGGDPNNSAAMVNLGTLYAQSGRLAEAAALWERALTRNPANTQARLNLAVARIKLGRRGEGIAALRTALRYDPDHRAAADLLRQLE